MKKQLQLNIFLYQVTEEQYKVSWLFLNGYFRKFVPRYASIALPLTDLLKEEAKFIFGDKEKHAFNQLKKALSKGPITS